MAIFYEKLQGTNTLVIARKKGSATTDKCGFCGKRHYHSIEEGHRLSHCPDKYIKGKRIIHHNDYECKADDGTVLKVTDGYIIREY